MDMGNVHPALEVRLMEDETTRVGDSGIMTNDTFLDLLISFLVLVAVVGGVFVPTLTHEFSNWDDPKHIVAIWKPSWQRAWMILTDWNLRYTGVSYFSPLHFLSLMVDQVLVGPALTPQAWISKLMNIAYHGANATLVFVLFSVLGLGRRAALFGALLFAVHPLQVGTVAWVAERKNLLGTLFYVGSFLSFVRYSLTRRFVYVVLVVGCFAAGLLSKPSVVTLPVVLALWFWWAGDGRPRGKTPYPLFAVLLAGSVAWGLYTVSTEVAYKGMLPALAYRPLLASGALLFYVSKFLYPVELVPVYPKWDVEGTLPLFILGLGIVAAATAAMTYWRNRINRLILFGLLFFVINVIPVAGLVPFGHMSHSFVADHFMYLPMVGLSLAVGQGFQLISARIAHRKNLQTAAITGAYMVVCALGVQSIHQGSIWQDQFALWEATLRVNRSSPAVYNNYGLAALMSGKPEKAEELFQKALELSPNLAPAYQNLGRLYYNRRDRDGARKMFEKARSLKPQDNFPRLMLGTMLREDGKYSEAVDFLKKCLQDTPKAYLLRIELARTYKEAGQPLDALDELDRAIGVDPLNPIGYLNKAAVLQSLGRLDESITQLEMSLENGETAEARNLLGVVYLAKGRPEMSWKELARAHAIAPLLPGLPDNMARALILLNRMAEAQEICAKEAAHGRPCSEEVLKQLAGTQRDG